MINASKKKYQEFSCGTTLPCFSHLQFEKLKIFKCSERFFYHLPPDGRRVKPKCQRLVNHLIVRYYKILILTVTALASSDKKFIIFSRMTYKASNSYTNIHFTQEPELLARRQSVTKFSFLIFRIFILIMYIIWELSKKYRFFFFPLFFLFFCMASCNAQQISWRNMLCWQKIFTVFALQAYCSLYCILYQFPNSRLLSCVGYVFCSFLYC